MRYRITRHSRWSSVLVCVPLMPAIFYITLFAIKSIFDELIRLGIVGPSKTQTDLFSIATLFITSITTGIIYNKFRWRIVDDPTLFCIQCGYNLTGNESGVCSECGTEINP